MNESELRKLFELYLIESCAFSLIEKGMLHASFHTWKKDTQLLILKLLQDEHQQHISIINQHAHG